MSCVENARVQRLCPEMSCERLAQQWDIHKGSRDRTTNTSFDLLKFSYDHVIVATLRRHVATVVGGVSIVEIDLPKVYNATLTLNPSKNSIGRNVGFRVKTPRVKTLSTIQMENKLKEL